LAEKRTFAADTMGDGYAQTPVIQRRVGERLKSTLCGPTGFLRERHNCAQKQSLPGAR
jgi:hypothetical protein